MTPRDVISLLTNEQRAEIADVCLEYLPPDEVARVVISSCTEDELCEVGIAIRRFVTKNSSAD